MEKVLKKTKIFSRRKNGWQVNLFIILMLAIPLLNFAVFTVYANIGGIIFSFKNVDFMTNTEYFVGLANYKKFFEYFRVYEYGKVIMTSFGYLVAICFVSIPLSLLSAFFLFKKAPFAKFMIVIMFLPNIIPLSLTAEFYRQLFDPLTGFLSKFFNMLCGFTAETAPAWLNDPKYANMMLYVYTVWFGIGYNAILLWGAMTRVPKEVMESAQIDGAGYFTEFFKIILPIVWPTLSMVLLLGSAAPFTVYMQPLLVTFNGQAKTTTFALLALQTLKDKGDVYYSATLSIISACVSVPFILIVKTLLDKVFAAVEI